MSTLKVDTIQSSTLASPVTINDSLTVAGNTAVTGTLSATAQISSGADVAIPSISRLAFNAGSFLMQADAASGRFKFGSSVAGSTMLRIITGGTGDVTMDAWQWDSLSTQKSISIGGSTVAGPSGLAVTGTLSSTDTTTAKHYLFSGTAPVGVGNQLAIISGGLWLNTNTGTLAYLGAGGSGVLRWQAGAVDVTGTLSASGAISGATGSKIGSGTAITSAGRDYLTIGGTQLGSAAFKNGSDAVVAYMQSGAANFDLYANTGGTLRLGANGTDGLAIVSSTALTLGAGVNLVMAAGQGIDFSATANGSGTATSEVLSDYEEGTWTPTVDGMTSVGTGTYSVQTGTYTKIGRKVYFQLYLTWSAHTGTGNMKLSGLPYTPLATSNTFNSVTFGRCNDLALTAGNILNGYVDTASASVQLAQYPTGGGSQAAVPIDTAASIMASGCYFV